MLILPAIHILNGRCVHRVAGEQAAEALYVDDPVTRTLLWRGENAKALHVVDLDGARSGHRVNAQCIQRMVESVDIAIQLAGGFRTHESVSEVLTGLGIYRVVVGTLAVEQPALLEKLLADFTARKIVVGIDSAHGFVQTHGRERQAALTSVDHARRMKELGVERIVFTDVEHVWKKLGPPIEELKRIAGETGLCITLNGSVRHYADLKLVQSLQTERVDSLILTEALYANAFPCQEIWRQSERLLMERDQQRQRESRVEQPQE